MHERKIPTIIGLLLVVFAVMMFRFAFDRVGPLLTRASATHTPQQITVSNLSDTAFTVSWITAEETTGALIVEGITAPMYDDRLSITTGSNKQAKQSFSTHTISVRNIKPDTSYRFRILSGTKTFLNNGAPYETRTALPLTGTGTNLEPAYGQVTEPSGSPAEGAIVYVTPENGQTLSAIVNASGSWVIPLNLARTENFTTYLNPSGRINESIIIRSSEGEATALTDSVNDNPVPAMTIGKTYDFRKIQASENQNRPLTQASPAVLGTNTAHVSQPIIAITKPAQGSAMPSNLPLIQGTGVPGNSVLIILGMQNPVSSTTTVGEDGVWRYTPQHPLAEGKQSITITTTDQNNQIKALTNTFEILKSGTQVLGDATPSATLDPTPTIEKTPTPVATLSGEPMPTSGNELPLILLLTLGFILFLGGTGLLII